MATSPPAAASGGRRDARTKEQLLAEIDRLKSSGWIEQAGSTARTVVRVAGVCFVAYMAKEAIRELAGRDTTANILVEFLASIKVSVAIAWGAAAGGVAYGYYERKLRKRAVHKLTARKSELEKLLDPTRSSSGLTHTGDTNPEDDGK